LLLTLLATATSAQSLVVRDLELTGAEDAELRGQFALSEVGAMKLKRSPRHGDVTLEPATGSFVFHPVKDFNGDDTFAIEVSAGKQARVAKVSLHVAAENDRAVVKPLSLRRSRTRRRRAASRPSMPTTTSSRSASAPRPRTASRASMRRAR